jgi:transcriptional regulator with XRE-family HTH domain
MKHRTMARGNNVARHEKAGPAHPGIPRGTRAEPKTLATKAGLSRGYLARVETGRNEPSLSMLEKLAKALRVKVAKLLE